MVTLMNTSPLKPAVPTELRRLGPDGLQITWANGLIQKFTSKNLRTNCPCAHCRELRGDTSHSTPLTPIKSSLRIIEHSISEELRLERIWSIGNYALGMQWADGHNTGIYTFDFLATLAPSS